MNNFKQYTEENRRPNFKMEDWILAGVYDHIDKNILGYDWDLNHEDIAEDLMNQFKQVRDMIERRYNSSKEK